MSPEQALTRERLVAAALDLINQDGLDGLSMRALAGALDVRASSLYWHVRDRSELVELLAGSILDSVRVPARRAGWRADFLAACAALGARAAGQRDATRILLEVPGSLTRSAIFAELRDDLLSAGLRPAEAAEVALAAMVQVVASPAPAGAPVIGAGSVASIAVDSGSRGVLLRAGSQMEGLIRTVHEQASAAPAVVLGDRVVVRRLRGVGRGELELNPRHPWSFQIQGATWNTVLDLGGIDVRAVKLDSGAARVECILPRPRGVVAIEVSGGVVGLALHRSRGVAVAADISAGAMRLKLDGHSLKASVAASRWESEDGAAMAPDRYQLRINSGAVNVRLDSEGPPNSAPETGAPVDVAVERVSAVEILLDGVESRVSGRAREVSEEVAPPAQPRPRRAATRPELL